MDLTEDQYQEMLKKLLNTKLIERIGTGPNGEDVLRVVPEEWEKQLKIPQSHWKKIYVY